MDRDNGLQTKAERIKLFGAARTAKLLDRILRLNRLYSLLSATNRAIVNTVDRSSLFRDCCRAAVEEGGFRLAWVGLVDDSSGLVLPGASFGETGYLEGIRISAREEPDGMGPTGTSIRSGTYHICNDFFNTEITLPWQERARAHGLFASASIALREEGRVIGAMTLYADQKDYFDANQVDLFRQMAMDMSFALDNFASRERRLEAEEALSEKQRELVHQSRQAAMGNMIGNIAHQWRQPLNALGITVQKLLPAFDGGKLDRDYLKKAIDDSMRLIQHMSLTVDDFRNYFKPDRERLPFRLRDSFTNALSLMDGIIKSNQIEVEIRQVGDPVVHGFSNDFSQAILNIMINAKDVLAERAVEKPRISIRLWEEGEIAVASVVDNAGGIPADIMPRIFDPYFTTKGDDAGTGVGLFMSKTIIEQNLGGRIIARNIEDGAEFRIELPMAAGEGSRR